MGRAKVHIRFSREQEERLSQFHNALRRSGDKEVLLLSREDLIRKLAFYALDVMEQEAYRIQAEKEAETNARNGNTPSNPESLPSSEATDSPTLAHSETSGANTGASTETSGVEQT